MARIPRGKQPWHKLYKTARWYTIRRQQLTAHPLCQRCLDAKPKRITPATVVHHVNRHHGDPVLFYTGPFASSCAPCHDSIEQGIERRGYDTTIGEDGWPSDAAHPANRVSRETSLPKRNADRNPPNLDIDHATRRSKG